MVVNTIRQERVPSAFERLWRGLGRSLPVHVVRPSRDPARRAQLERARLVALKLDAQLDHADQNILAVIDAGLEALAKQPPEIQLAENIRRAVEDRLSASFVLGRIVTGTILSAAAIVIIAVGVTWWPFVRLPWMPPNQTGDQPTLLGFSTYELWWYALTGALGGVISVLLRIADFKYVSRLASNTQFWSGAFRPLIGATFALFLYFLVASELLASVLKVPSEPLAAHGFYLALAFLAGFSERLAPATVTRAEAALGMTSSSTTAKTS
ncbi:MAG: hypothetical protein M3069_24350 [Chloroflexota bacterium]|nr:hypothetical protein [Chloroflexota bacterium]